MNLSTAAQWAEIIGLVTILGAAIYSYFQINEMKKVREGAASLSLAELLQSADFAAGIIQVIEQPDDLDNWEKFKEYHGERWPQAFSIMTTWESLGAVVHRGDINFHLVYDFFSGIVQQHHDKCQPLILSQRESGGDTRFEWFTWLAERFGEYEDNEQAPLAAHLQYKDWRPPKKAERL